MARATKLQPRITNDEELLIGDQQADQQESYVVNIPKLNIKRLPVQIMGTAPLMIMRFSQKSKDKMQETQEAGTQARSKKNRAARNFEEDSKNAAYRFADGSYGINAISFRHAMVESCRYVDYKMTVAKGTIFIVADGYDVHDSTPLVRIHSPKPPETRIMPVRNATGVIDLRARPVWMEWGCNLTVEFDADRFHVNDILNLLTRAGVQNGVGEGRPNSKRSVGLGFGTWAIVSAGVKQ